MFKEGSNEFGLPDDCPSAEKVRPRPPTPTGARSTKTIRVLAMCLLSDARIGLVTLKYH